MYRFAVTVVKNHQHVSFGNPAARRDGGSDILRPVLSATLDSAPIIVCDSLLSRRRKSLWTALSDPKLYHRHYTLA